MALNDLTFPRLRRDPCLHHTGTAAVHNCIWTELSILIGKLLRQAFYLMAPGGWGGGAADVAALRVVFLAEVCWCNRAITLFVIRECTAGVAAGRATGLLAL